MKRVSQILVRATPSFAQLLDEVWAAGYERGWSEALKFYKKMKEDHDNQKRE